jgi:hypothetical protein
MDNRWSRRRYVLLYSPTKGKLLVDTYAKRLWLLRKRLFAWAGLMQGYCQDNDVVPVMVGLTYAKADDYDAGDIREYVKKIKQMMGEKLVAFAWVAEMQRRGALHYHVLFVVEKGKKIPKPDQSGMWTKGSSSIAKAKSFYYICEYVGKEYQKNFDAYPKSARLYSASIRRPEALQRAYKVLSGLNRSYSPDEDNSNDFEYIGATCTEKYADLLLETKLATMGLP